MPPLRVSNAPAAIMASRSCLAIISALALISGLGEPARANPVIPNDPGFGAQWADQNMGQPVPGEEAATGTPSADDSAARAWAATTGSPSIVIGELLVGSTVDVAFRLERDEWNGESRLQARLADFRA